MLYSFPDLIKAVFIFTSHIKVRAIPFFQQRFRSSSVLVFCHWFNKQNPSPTLYSLKLQAAKLQQLYLLSQPKFQQILPSHPLDDSSLSPPQLFSLQNTPKQGEVRAFRMLPFKPCFKKKKKKTNQSTKNQPRKLPSERILFILTDLAWAPAERHENSFQ